MLSCYVGVHSTMMPEYSPPFVCACKTFTRSLGGAEPRRATVVAAAVACWVREAGWHHRSPYVSEYLNALFYGFRYGMIS